MAEMNQDLRQPHQAPCPGRLAALFFGSRQTAFVSSLFCLAVALLLYVVYLQVQEAAQIELPTGQAEQKTALAPTAKSSIFPEVLILNSYHAGHVWSDNEVAGIVETLQAAPKISYAIEYLDCKRHPKYEHFEQVRDLFKVKYGGREVPVVVVTDDPALDFVLKYRTQLFPRSTVVFCGVNNFTREMLGGQEDITGLAEALNAIDTVRVALALHPGTREILLLHDYTATGLATRRQTEEQLRGLATPVHLRYGEEMTKPELTRLLADLPADTLVLALAYSVFKGGEVIAHEDMARLLSKSSPVPVYGLHQERLGNGIVGGSLLSGKLHGAQAAQIARRILTGGQAAAIPVELAPPTRLMFDYNQLQRFAIPLAALPTGSVVVNRPIAFIASHRYLALSTLLVFILLTAGLLVLASSVYQRRLAEEGLRQAKADLEQRVGERTAALLDANEQLQIELGERAKAEALAQQREAELNESQRLAHIGCWDWDAVADTIWWSGEYHRLYQVDPALPTPNYREHLLAYTPASAGRLEAAVNQAMATGEPYELELELAKPTAEVRWIVARGEAKRKAGGQIRGLRGTAQNISERRRAEEERLANLKYFASMDSVNRAIQGTSDLEQMASDVLDVMLAVFDCDRAFLLYPCSPEAPAWRCPMERTKPQYPGLLARAGDVPTDSEAARVFRTVLAASGPVKFGPGFEPLPTELAEQFGFQAEIALALHPKFGKPWMFGLHQCLGTRVWTADEERLFEETGRRLAEALSSLLVLQNLQESEGKLAEAQRIAHFGYWDRDFEAGTIALSDEACRIFGMPPQGELPLLGEWHEQWLQLIHPEDRPRATRALAEALHGDRPYDVEYRVVLPGGEVRSLHIYAELTRDESGQPRRMFGTMQDITERQKTEETIRQLNKELEQRVSGRTTELQSKSQQLLGSRQALMNLVDDLNTKTAELEDAKAAAETANHAKSGFLANMSHELRTPLNAILGFAQLLDRSPELTAEHRENVGIIIRSGEHLLGLINDVLEIAKIEAGYTPLHMAPFDLHHLLQGIGEMFSARAQASGLYFRSALDPGLPRYVTADAGKLRQVLINLLGNAHKFTKVGGVCLSVQPTTASGEAAGMALHFAVEDSGIGIAAEKVGIIFDPFVQVGTSKEQTSGTGLGLAISRHFVELMGGTLTAKSTLGQGSVFSFAIPVTIARRADLGAEPSARRVKGLAPGQQAYRILIVEDREENRLLLRRVLEGAGFTVQEATNGLEGVELFNSWQPDFVWMDIRMPVLDGVEATKRIKATAKGAHTPVVALTASAFDEQRANIMAAGCDGFIRKPFSDDEIWGVMEQHLGVRFLYEEPPPPPPTLPPLPLATATLDLMEPNLLLNLSRAALACERETCLALIEGLPPAQGPAAETLRHYVMQHKFDKLYEMLETHLSGRGNDTLSD